MSTFSPWKCMLVVLESPWKVLEFCFMNTVGTLYVTENLFRIPILVYALAPEKSLYVCVCVCVISNELHCNINQYLVFTTETLHIVCVFQTEICSTVFTWMSSVLCPHSANQIGKVALFSFFKCIFTCLFFVIDYR